MRMKQKKVWILSGVPGSGKSTWARKQIAEHGGVYCSRDEIRFSLLKEDEDYFAHEDEVIRLWTEKIHNAIKDPEVWNVLIDATHLNDKSRKNIIDNLPEGDYIVVITIFDVPLETCLERNDNRTGRAFVPRSVIRRMHYSFEKESELGDAVVYIGEDGEVIHDMGLFRLAF